MIALVLALALVGVVLYLIAQIPMDPWILIAIRVVVLVCVIYLLMRVFGVADIPLPRAR